MGLCKEVLTFKNSWKTKQKDFFNFTTKKVQKVNIFIVFAPVFFRYLRILENRC